MSVKPILFNTDMVKVILDGRKSCTRRCVKYKYSNTEMKIRTDKYGTRIVEIQKDIEGETFGKNPDGSTWHKLLGYIEPKAPYKKGDILYVRETWQYLYELDGNEQVIEDTGKYYYAATDTIPFNTYVDENGVRHDHAPWRPSIHMPKEAARIFLRVTNVRVERLQEMKDEDCEKEGLENFCKKCSTLFSECDTCLNDGGIKEDFKELWDSTIKKSDLATYGWDANPWVWVIEFERCEKPESEGN